MLLIEKKLVNFINFLLKEFFLSNRDEQNTQPETIFNPLRFRVTFFDLISLLGVQDDVFEVVYFLRIT